MQATVYFVGQVILSNLDILLVKHFFPPSEAGIYAAVALVGRVILMLSWSVVSSMFPVSAGSSHRKAGHSVLYTALLLVGTLTSAFVVAVALAPEAVWTMLLGKLFLLGTVAFSALLTKYAIMTAIYSIAVVVMMYEISRRIGPAAWVQLGASLLLIGGDMALSRFLIPGNCGATVRDVRIAGSRRLFRSFYEQDGIERNRLRNLSAACGPCPRKRSSRNSCAASSIIPSSIPIAGSSSILWTTPILVIRMKTSSGAHCCSAGEGACGASCLRIRSGGRLNSLRATCRACGRSRATNGGALPEAGSHLTEMVGRVKADLARGRQSRFLKKLGAIGSDLRGNDVPDAVLLIGIDEHHPLTIIEGNHRMAAAMLTMPESAHRRFRFYCGLSPNMNSCCWHKTDVRSLTRYARHTVRYMFRDGTSSWRGRCGRSSPRLKHLRAGASASTASGEVLLGWRGTRVTVRTL